MALYISPIRSVQRFPESFVSGMSPFPTAQASKTSTDKHQIIGRWVIFITKSIPLLHNTCKYRSSICWFRITKQIVCFPGERKEETQKVNINGQLYSNSILWLWCSLSPPIYSVKLRKTHCNIWFNLVRYSSKQRRLIKTARVIIVIIEPNAFGNCLNTTDGFSTTARCTFFCNNVKQTV